ncbi:unnamed protein product [Durusdinium trenchii]|uniref:Uncharacterized protein n=1 Tax=Durusdinium trenchii TaxID=1381693 RepID=A0ABP0JV86_9DINO
MVRPLPEVQAQVPGVGQALGSCVQLGRLADGLHPKRFGPFEAHCARISDHCTIS